MSGKKKSNYGTIGGANKKTFGSPIEALRQNSNNIDGLLTVAFGESEQTKANKKRKLKESAMRTMTVAIQEAEIEASELKKKLTDGHIGFRALAYFGAAVLIACASLGILSDLVTLSVTEFMEDVFLILFSIIIVFSEARTKTAHETMQVRDFIGHYFKFLDLVWGRGCFYIYVGILAMGRWPNVLTFSAGVFLFAAGFIAVIAGMHVSSQLSSLRTQLKGKDSLKKAFNKYDVDNSNGLSSAEFAALAKDLGSQLTHAELEAAILCMDKNRDGVIEFDEFFAWWSEDSGAGKYAV